MVNEDCNYDKQQPDPCDRTQLRAPRRSNPCDTPVVQPCGPDLTNLTAPIRDAEVVLPVIEYATVQSTEQTVSCPVTSYSNPKSVVVPAGHAKKTLALPAHINLREAALQAAQAEVDAVAEAYAYSKLSCAYGNTQQTLSCPTYTDSETEAPYVLAVDSRTLTAASNTQLVTLTGADNAPTQSGIAKQSAALAEANTLAQAWLLTNIDCQLRLSGSQTCAAIFNQTSSLEATVAHTSRSSHILVHIDDLAKDYKVLIDPVTGEFQDRTVVSAALAQKVISATTVWAQAGTGITIENAADVQTYGIEAIAWPTVGPIAGGAAAVDETRPIPSSLLAGFDAADADAVWTPGDRLITIARAYVEADCSLVNSAVDTECQIDSYTSDNTVDKPAFDSNRYTLESGAYSWTIPLAEGNLIPDQTSQLLQASMVEHKKTLQQQADNDRALTQLCYYNNDMMIITCECDFAGVVDCTGDNIYLLGGEGGLAAGTAVWFTHDPGQGAATWLGIVEDTLPGFRPDLHVVQPIAQPDLYRYPYPVISKVDLEVSVAAGRYVVVKEGTVQGRTIAEANELAKAQALLQLDCTYSNPEVSVLCGWDLSGIAVSIDGSDLPNRSFYRETGTADVYYKDMYGVPQLVSANSVNDPSVLWSSSGALVPAGIITSNCIINAIQAAYDMAKVQRDCLWCNPRTPGECEDNRGTDVGDPDEGIISVSYVAEVPEATYCATSLITTLSLVTQAMTLPEVVKTGGSTACLYDAGDVVLEVVDTHIKPGGGKSFIGYLNYLNYLHTGSPIVYKYKVGANPEVQYGVVKRFAILPHPFAVDLSKSSRTQVTQAGSVQVEVLPNETGHEAEARAVTQALESMLNGFSVVGTASIRYGLMGLTDAETTSMEAFDTAQGNPFAPRVYSDYKIPLEAGSVTDPDGTLMAMGYSYDTHDMRVTKTMNPVYQTGIDNPGFYSGNGIPPPAGKLNEAFSTWRNLGGLEDYPPAYEITNVDRFRYYRHYGEAFNQNDPIALFLDGYETGCISTQMLAANPKFVMMGEIPGTVEAWKLLDITKTQRASYFSKEFQYVPPMYVLNTPPAVHPDSVFFDTCMQNLVSLAVNTITDTKARWWPHVVALSCTGHTKVQTDAAADERFTAECALRYTLATDNQSGDPGTYMELLSVDVRAPTLYVLGPNQAIDVNDPRLPLSAAQPVLEAEAITLPAYRDDNVANLQTQAVAAMYSIAYSQLECEWCNAQVEVKCQDDNATALANYVKLADRNEKVVVTDTSASLVYARFPQTVVAMQTWTDVITNSTLTAPPGTVTLPSKIYQDGPTKIDFCTDLAAMTLAIAIDCTVGNRPVEMACHTVSLDNGYYVDALEGKLHPFALESELEAFDAMSGLHARNWVTDGIDETAAMTVQGEPVHSLQAIVAIPSDQFQFRTPFGTGVYGGSVLKTYLYAVDMQAITQAKVSLVCTPELPGKTYSCSDQSADWAAVAHGDDDSFDAPAETVGLFNYGDSTSDEVGVIANVAAAVRDFASRLQLQCEIRSAPVLVGGCEAQTSDQGARQAGNLIALMRQTVLTPQLTLDDSVLDPSMYVKNTEYIAVGGGFYHATIDIIENATPPKLPDPAPMVYSIVDGNADYKQEHVKLNAELGAELFAAYSCAVGNTFIGLSAMCFAGELDAAAQSIAANTVIEDLRPAYDAVPLDQQGRRLFIAKQELAQYLATQLLNVAATCKAKISGISFSCFDCSDDAITPDEIEASQVVGTNDGIRLYNDVPLTMVKCKESTQVYRKLVYYHTTLEEEVRFSANQPATKQRQEVITIIKTAAAVASAQADGCADQTTEVLGSFMMYLKIESGGTDSTALTAKVVNAGGALQNQSYKNWLHAHQAPGGTTGDTVFAAPLAEQLLKSAASALEVGSLTSSGSGYLDSFLRVTSISTKGLAARLVKNMDAVGGESPVGAVAFSEWIIGKAINVKESGDSDTWDPDVGTGTTPVYGSVLEVEKTGVDYVFPIATASSTGHSTVVLDVPGGGTKTVTKGTISVAQHLSGSPLDLGIAPLQVVSSNIHGVNISRGPHPEGSNTDIGCGSTTVIG